MSTAVPGGQPTSGAGPESAWRKETEPLEAGTLVRRLAEAIPAALASQDAEQQAAGASAAVASAVRSAVLAEFRTRAQFAGRICEIDARIWGQEGIPDVMRSTADEHLSQLGLRRVTDPVDGAELFVITEGKGDVLEVIRPAYLDEVTGQTVLGGQLRRRPAAPAGHNNAPGNDESARGEEQ
ncbi:hypothetical protein ACGFX4_19165 [Kitasatospora sp. NPDC048365]|uniref:hypothetical protein n=1 Tax=Kitasatospora sp. NPDC048365 TaxID=3364050 RepID=UPI003720FD9F